MSLNIDMFIPIIKELVLDISKGDYKKIEQNGRIGRVTGEELKKVIAEYGCKVIPVPDDAFELAECHYIESENVLDIYMPLWTKEEGRSDLTLSMSCQQCADRLLIEIDDLGVL